MTNKNNQNSRSLTSYSPASPGPLNARSLRSLGFPKSPPLKKILDPPMNKWIKGVHR